MAKRALVTGASQGIGREIALRLADEGAWVAVNYFQHGEAAEAVVQQVTAQGGTALAVQADISNAAAVEEMLQRVVDRWRGVDILVNNAGITSDNLLLRMSEEEWDKVMDTNLKGVFLVTKAALRHMVRQRWGRVLNMSSVVAITGNPGQANYTAAKAGLIGFTRTIAREVASRNITVNALAPGFITTQMVEQLSQQTQEAIKERIPLGRFGSPQDVASLAAFLASEEAGYITGQTIGVDGGLGI